MQKSPQIDSSRQIGVRILGRKRPGFDQEWNQIMCRRSLKTLQSVGFTSVGADSPVVDDHTLHAALQQIHLAKCEVLLVLQPSIGNGQLALTVSQHWPNPVVLWATPERPEDGKVSSCSLVGQHLWASVLRQAGHPFEFVYGDAENAEVRADLTRAIALCRTFRYLQRAKVGVVGTLFCCAGRLAFSFIRSVFHNILIAFAQFPKKPSLRMCSGSAPWDCVRGISLKMFLT